MRNRSLCFALVLGTLLACGGGGAGSVSSTPATPAAAWSPAVDLESVGYVTGARLTGDGKGGAVAVWTRTATDTGGTQYWENVAARLRADGTWDTPRSLEVSTLLNVLQDPIPALDDRGKGLIAWLSAVPRSSTTVVRTVPVDLGVGTGFGTRTNGLSLNLLRPRGLALATGSDGSALAAWTWDRDIGLGAGYEVPAVYATRLDPAGAWSTPRGYHLNQLSHQGLNGVSGNGRGAFLLAFSTGDDAWEESEVASFTQGSGVGDPVAGWMPTSQIAYPAGHVSAVATDGQGGLETFLLYPVAGEGDAQRQAWPRSRSAAGTWTVGAKVALPMPANNLVAFREASGAGWLAGLGAEGLWVAPLTGVTPGSPRTLLPAPTTTEVLIGTRDASGRPALLWIQRGTGGVHQGIGFSRWDGSAWTTPVILPGTAGATIQRISATAGPGGLLAGWVEGGTSLRFRSALWK